MRGKREKKVTNKNNLQKGTVVKFVNEFDKLEHTVTEVFPGEGGGRPITMVAIHDISGLFGEDAFEVVRQPDPAAAPAKTRRIDGKFHVEGSQIVKTSNGEVVPEDEPLFILRARDRLALPILKIYEQLSIVDGCNDYHFRALDESVKLFEQFRILNPERMKQPSVTRGK